MATQWKTISRCWAPYTASNTTFSGQTIPANTILDELGFTGDWLRTKYNNKICFTKKANVVKVTQPSSSSTTNPVAVTSANSYTAKSNAPMYSTAQFSTNSRLKDSFGNYLSVPVNTKVAMISIAGNTMKICYNTPSGGSYTGFVSAGSFYKTSSGDPGYINAKWYVAVDSAKTYTQASASGASKMSLAKYKTFTTKAGSTSSWLNTEYGWIQTSNCKPGDPPAVSQATPSSPVSSSKSTSASSTKQSSVSNSNQTYSPMPAADESDAIADSMAESIQYSSGVVYTDVYDVLSIDALNSAIEFGDQIEDISSVLGVFGVPYQFLPTADGRLRDSQDPRGDYQGIGMEYSDKIVGKMPIFFIAPGRPNFMGRYSKEENKQTILERLVGQVGISDINDLFNDNKAYRYYTFEYQPVQYYHYVNPMCREAAVYLGLDKIKIPVKGGGMQALGTMNWRDYVMGNFSLKDLLNQEYMHVPFYLDSDVSSDDSFGNSTGESTLAGSVNGISDMARELRFLTGYSNAALDAGLLDNPDVKASLENIQDIVKGALGKNHFLESLGRHLSTVANGGKLLFPEIWTSSDTGRSYSVKIKLSSPDNDKLSIYLNILVPLFHLLPLVGPQADPENPNGFTAPFIVRGIYKSFFNVDSGIITGMNITRGAEAQWTVDGIPSVVDVTINIKDLYDVLTFSSTKEGELFNLNMLANTAQMDYISNLCGINMYKPEISRMISSYLALFKGNLSDIPRDIWGNVNLRLGNIAANAYDRLMRRK